MSSQNNSSVKHVILRWPEVRARVGLSRSQVHNLIAQGKFPRQIKLGVKASGWLESDIDEWIEARISDSCCGAE